MSEAERGIFVLFLDHQKAFLGATARIKDLHELVAKMVESSSLGIRHIYAQFKRFVSVRLTLIEQSDTYRGRQWPVCTA